MNHNVQIVWADGAHIKADAGDTWRWMRKHKIDRMKDTNSQARAMVDKSVDPASPIHSDLHGFSVEERADKWTLGIAKHMLRCISEIEIERDTGRRKGEARRLLFNVERDGVGPGAFRPIEHVLRHDEAQEEIVAKYNRYIRQYANRLQSFEAIRKHADVIVRETEKIEKAYSQAVAV